MEDTPGERGGTEASTESSGGERDGEPAEDDELAGDGAEPAGDGDLVRVRAGELTADEIIAALVSGTRVIVTVDLFGSTTDIALRHDGEIYYCDTPTRLHKHQSEAEMRNCIERMGYSRSDRDAES